MLAVGLVPTLVAPALFNTVLALQAIGVVAALAVPSVLPFLVRDSRIDGPWFVMLACGARFAEATGPLSGKNGRPHP